LPVLLLLRMALWRGRDKIIISMNTSSLSSSPRRLVILGATGSIGHSVADVIAHAPDHFDVEAVVGGQDAKALAQMAVRVKARHAAIADDRAYDDLSALLSGTGISVAAGLDAVIEAALRPADMVIAAIVGTAGVKPTYAAVSAGRTIALANKECLVCAGAPFMSAAQECGAVILPMDSEHNALFQALGHRPLTSVKRMTLTASGGPFREWSHAQIDAATPEQALRHPNWSMGPKVTIDSASLMNKGLELIEAHFLFGVQADALDVLIHPQSIVHGLVSFEDGSVIAGLAQPDMRVPIAHCLAYPERIHTQVTPLDLAQIGRLDFAAPDLERFPALGLAYHALRTGGALPTILNAANEMAVQAFLDHQISFLTLVRSVGQVCEDMTRAGQVSAITSIDDALVVDAEARARSLSILNIFRTHL
jgi:1-deoxy-D-xylulose-5-phosphate reductoisomerase